MKAYKNVTIEILELNEDVITTSGNGMSLEDIKNERDDMIDASDLS